MFCSSVSSVEWILSCSESWTTLPELKEFDDDEVDERIFERDLLGFFFFGFSSVPLVLHCHHSFSVVHPSSHLVYLVDVLPLRVPFVCVIQEHVS